VPAELAVSLYGGRMNFDRVVEGTDFHYPATRFGFIVVYPKAEPGGFFNSGDRGLSHSGLDSSVDDVAFVRHLIEHIGAEYALDPSRLFATGQSNGASIAHRLGCELSDQIAAIGPVAGELMIECHPGQPVSVIEFHGLDDPIFPFMGGVGKFGGMYPPVEATFAKWRELDGCPGQGNLCKAGTDVVLHTVPGPDGHGWPANATQKIWDFFAAHPRR
jgi:polyhydroxybutyrate depolymerase